MPDAEHLLRELLASIHGDGGHYAEKFGLERATEDAVDRWCRANVIRANAEALVAQGPQEGHPFGWLLGALEAYNDPEYRARQALAAALDKDDPL